MDIKIMATIPITLKITNIIDNSNYESLTSGFNFKYKEINYVVTVHHGQLIDNLKIEDNNYNAMDDQVINTIWNELLIIKNTHANNYKLFKNYRLYAPHKNEILFIKSNVNVKIKMINYEFINLNNMSYNPYNLYLECEMNEIISDLKSLSGSPVITKDNRLVGIMSKFNMIKNTVYIIPVYYLIKTLNKKSNDEIYGINFEGIENVPKTLYNKFLKVDLPIETYMMLEGDQDKQYKINKTLLRFENINNIFPLSNSRYLETQDECYVVTNCFLITIKNIIGKHIKDVIKFIDLFKNKKILCSIVKSSTNTINSKFKRQFMIDNEEYDIILRC